MTKRSPRPAPQLCEVQGCTRPMRRDMLLHTCWQHASAETRYILGKMVESKIVGKDQKQ